MDQRAEDDGKKGIGHDRKDGPGDGNQDRPNSASKNARTPERQNADEHACASFASFYLFAHVAGTGRVALSRQHTPLSRRRYSCLPPTTAGRTVRIFSAVSQDSAHDYEPAKDNKEGQHSKRVRQVTRNIALRKGLLD